MVRYVFFSFHYERDVWRANQIRHSWVTRDIAEAGFIDTADFEEVQRKGDAAIKKWIDDQLIGTSVTVVLIGTETSTRPYVTYEIQQSYVKKNGLLGIYIHNLKDQKSQTDYRGSNPFDSLYIPSSDGSKTYLSNLYPTYDWVTDRGYENIGKWVEQAAQKAGK